MIKEQVKLIWDSVFHPSQTDCLQSQVIRQAISGFTATVVDLSIFKGLLTLGVWVLLAAFFSSTISIIVNFNITRFYVYGHLSEQKTKTPIVQFVYYILTVSVSLGMVLVILQIFSVRMGYDPLLVKICAIPVVFIWTVVSGRYIVFRRTRKKPPS
ncbi:MAG: GtrA family protein [Deltaproteobacteria bacterium]|jgi:putative flippase GtrA|nr:GtrA family protein [Deltaproteobacteria bacterium]